MNYLEIWEIISIDFVPWFAWYDDLKRCRSRSLINNWSKLSAGVGGDSADGVTTLRITPKAAVVVAVTISPQISWESYPLPVFW